MATQYTLTGSFTAITEDKGTIQNVGTESVELVSTTNAVVGEGIVLLPGEKRTFKGAMSARAMGDAGADINVVDFTDAAEGGDVMTGASADADGTAGLVPQPTAGNENRFLRGDGTWAIPTDEDTQYQPATTLTDGLMSATDKTNLDTIESNYRQPSTIYTAGQIAYHSALPTGYYLECTTAGTSGSGELTISSPSIGGTVTDGTVVWKVSRDFSVFGGKILNEVAMTRNGDGKALLIAGGTQSNYGGFIQLYGEQYPYDINQGAFKINAKSSDLISILKGTPGGGLTWNDNDLAGSAIVAKSLGANGYIKYASGLIVQWGTNKHGEFFTPPISFTTPLSLTACIRGDGQAINSGVAPMITGWNLQSNPKQIYFYGGSSISANANGNYLFICM